MYVHGWNFPKLLGLISCPCQTYDFLLTPDGRTVVEDLHPSSKKVVAVPDGYILQNVTGIRARIVTRLDGKGYDITKCKPSSSCAQIRH